MAAAVAAKEAEVARLQQQLEGGAAGPSAVIEAQPPVKVEDQEAAAPAGSDADTVGSDADEEMGEAAVADEKVQQQQEAQEEEAADVEEEPEDEAVAGGGAAASPSTAAALSPEPQAEAAAQQPADAGGAGTAAGEVDGQGRYGHAAVGLAAKFPDFDVAVIEGMLEDQGGDVGEVAAFLRVRWRWGEGKGKTGKVGRVDATSRKGAGWHEVGGWGWEPDEGGSGVVAAGRFEHVQDRERCTMTTNTPAAFQLRSFSFWALVPTASRRRVASHLPSCVTCNCVAPILSTPHSAWRGTRPPPPARRRPPPRASPPPAASGSASPAASPRPPSPGRMKKRPPARRRRSSRRRRRSGTWRRRLRRRRRGMRRRSRRARRRWRWRWRWRQGVARRLALGRSGLRERSPARGGGRRWRRSACAVGKGACVQAAYPA